MTSTYATYTWVITAVNPDVIRETSEVGTHGPSEATPEQVTNARHHGIDFRLVGEDGDVYYFGRIVGNFQGTEPLDEFGEPMGGCTRIEYLNAK